MTPTIRQLQENLSLANAKLIAKRFDMADAQKELETVSERVKKFHQQIKALKEQKAKILKEMEEEPSS